MRLLELKRDWRMNKGLYFLIFPIVVYLIIFNYVPMAGIVLGFERFTPKNGVYMSEWVGLKHFVTFFSSVFFVRVLKNTLIVLACVIVVGVCIWMFDYVAQFGVDGLRSIFHNH